MTAMPQDNMHADLHANLSGAVAAPKRPLRRIVAATFAIVLCFCLICGKILLDQRHAASERAIEAANSLVATLTSDIARNIESYDLSLRGVIDGLEFSEITQVSPALRQAILFDRSANAKHLHAIELLDDKGIVRLDSRLPFPKPINLSALDYFKVHVKDDTTDIYISEPFFTPKTHTHVIAISRRLTHADGTFAGVVVGTMELAYFQETFKNAALGPGGNITLSRTDGKLLMRWPYEEAMLGHDLSGNDLYKHLETARNGHFETTAVTDGVHRLIVYSRVGELPIVVGVGQSTEDIYADWRGYALIIGSLIALLCALSTLLILYLGREMKQRNASEAALAVLAKTDALTGLANRRLFNESIDREWRRAAREHIPLALVMCDTDLFKDYNDCHGHQAGDKLLQAVGTAMNQSMRRGTDIAARYGGDEFALLLPGASTDDAARIARQVRERFALVCTQLGIAHSTLSIGIASQVPPNGEDQSVLITAADEAAYRAKKLGRDRIEIASAKPVKLTVVSGAA